MVSLYKFIIQYKCFVNTLSIFGLNVVGWGIGQESSSTDSAPDPDSLTCVRSVFRSPYNTLQ